MQVRAGRGFEAILADLDGTLYFKKKLFPWAARTVREWKQAGFQVRFLTNTDSKSVRTLQRVLGEMGLTVPEDELFSPAVALLEFLEADPGKTCHFLLSEDLAGQIALAESGPRSEKVDYVIVGDFRESVAYETLNTAFRHLMSGADLIALQKGRYFATPEGPSLDTGSFVALLEFASGKIARVLGKPSADFFRMALESLGCAPEKAIVVGDEIATDVRGAKEAGAFSVLVRTGRFSEAELVSSPVKPDLVIDSARDLLEALAVRS